MTAMATTMSGPTGELTFETAVVDVTSDLPRPDPSWRYTDAQGHQHYWTKDGYPTLAYGRRPGLWALRVRHLTARRRWSDFRPLRRQCRICDEPIEPRMVASGGWREFAPGCTQWYFNGTPVSPQQAEGIRMSWAAMTPHRDNGHHPNG